jgi:hypothetical protein
MKYRLHCLGESYFAAETQNEQLELMPGALAL